MDALLGIAVVVPWILIGVLTWMIFTLIRQHGRALLAHDDLTARLTAAEQAISAVQADLAVLRTSGLADPHAGHDHGAPAQTSGLQPGTPAPAFSLANLEGRTRSLDDFMGTPTVVVFFNTQCGFCTQMAPRIGELGAAGRSLVLVGQGERGEYRQLAREHGWQCEVLLAPDLSVIQAFRGDGTPTGYLLDAEGRIASNLAIGADEVLRLIPGTGGASSNGHAGGHEHGHANGHGGALSADTLRANERAAADRAASADLPVRETTINRAGLTTGTAAPTFRLPDLDGHQKSLQDYGGKPLLLVFSDAGCAPCQELAPDLQKYHQQNSGASGSRQVLMVSRGERADNRAKAREHGLTFPVLLQKQWEISRRYAMFATPIAYLIDANGVTERDVLIGADAIRETLTVDGCSPRVRST